jgi:hypothetical protein
MKKIKILLSIILVAGLATTGYASATPSSGFHEKNGELFDDWDIARTRASGEDGFYQITETTFRPVIVLESLGEETSIAYRLGEQLAGKYPDPLQRAEGIFHFVRDRVNYTPDIDQFERDEFAQNADELAAAIDQNGVGYGDCEDSAALLAVMYKAAGYRTAIILAPGHTATMVYLPDYDKTPVAFDLEGEPGWVWAEATGRNNPLGWVPKEFIDVEIAAYEIEEETVARAGPAAAPSIMVGGNGGGGGGGSFSPFPFFSIFLLLWLLPMFRRRRTR